jgi:hypothetical protein
MKAPPAFVCTDNADCVRDEEQGYCETIDRCSFRDTECPTGRRYADGAGEQANRCVGDELPIDAGIDSAQLIDAGADATPIDGPPDAPPIDAPPGPCPSTYVALPGAPGHLYRKLTTAAGWTNQRAICGTEPANVHLAIADDATELAALVAFAGTQQWIGVSDAGDEGVFITVLDVPATFLPWDTGEPDNAGNQDCVRTKGATFETAGCGGLLVAVCECEP